MQNAIYKGKVLGVYKRNIVRHIFSVFLFDAEKERAIYLYLCKKRLRGRQKKLLTEETKFEKYQEWEDYLFARYGTLNLGSLCEFSKAMNLLLREVDRFDGYSKNLLMAYMSASLAGIFTVYASNVEDKRVLFFGLLVLPFFLSILISYVYKNWGVYEVYFYKDVREVIEKIIEEKVRHQNEDVDN